MKTAYIAALPRELATFASGSGWSKTRPTSGLHLHRCSTALAICAGIGASAVTRAFAAAVADPQIARIVSVGLAGACDPSLRVADVLHCSTVIDLRSGERFAASAAVGGANPVLVTSSVIADADEKARLHASYKAALVDMEGATLARLAHARGLPFAAIKAVSDVATTHLPDLSRFITRDGQLHEGRLAVHIALRPLMWVPAIQLGRDSRLAIAALANALNTDLAEQARPGVQC